MHDSFTSLFSESIAKGGFNKDASELDKRYGTSCPLIPVVNKDSPQPQRPLAMNEVEMIDNRLETPPTDSCQSEDTVDLGHGDVLIAAITSCTNTSNPQRITCRWFTGEKGCRTGSKCAFARKNLTGARLSRGT